MARMRELLAMALVATLGCEVADFDVERKGTATIPRNRPADGVPIMRLDEFELELAEIEDERGVSKKDLAEADLQRFRLEVIDPAELDLSFADRVEIYAEAPGLERVRVAWQDDFPVGARVVDLETDDVDLREYVAAPSVTLFAVIDGAAPPVDVRVRGIAELHLGVTLRGACTHM